MSAHARSEGPLGGLVAGVGATLTMDAVMVLGAKAAPAWFGTDKVDVNLIGRWAGTLARGARPHGGVTTWPAVPGEVAVGLAAHYLTGTVLTGTYLAALRRLGLAPGPVKATAYGVATAVLPLLVMFPSMGYGWCGRSSGDPRRVVSVMMLGHVGFGVGIAVWTGYQSHGTKRTRTRRR